MIRAVISENRKGGAMADSLKEVQSLEAESFRQMIERVFEAGRAKGREEIRDEYRQRLSTIFSEDIAPFPEPPTSTKPDAPPDTERAEPGTVKPRIWRLLLDRPDGLELKAIAEITGIKFNSVRGTLYNLKEKEKAVERRGDRWFATRKENGEPVGSPETADSDPEPIVSDTSAAIKGRALDL
jgi:hypothetical protein